MLSALDLKAFKELVDDKVELMIEVLEEAVQIAVSFYRQPPQIDRSEREVAAPVADLLFGVVYVGYNTSTAAHIRYFCFRLAFLVVFCVLRRVKK
jgi:hypothetical protein